MSRAGSLLRRSVQVTQRIPRIGARVALALALNLYSLGLPITASAGGPLVVGGTFGADGVPFTFDTSAAVQYRTDGGTLGQWSNATANMEVQQMFQVWQDIPTASISFNRAGAITGVADGDVNTVAEFNAANCPSGSTQNVVIYDADGQMFRDLGRSESVIGFAGPTRIASNNRITCASAALNGKWINNVNNPPNDGEISLDAFRAAFIHEFGHFQNLDHSQINTNCDPPSSPSPCVDNEDAFGFPTMYPFLRSSATEGGLPAQRTPAADDIGWVSRLYPETVNNPPTQVPFASVYGTITGSVFFSDGITGAQGVNVIARSTTQPRRNAVSVVSGYLFAGNLGQTVTGNNPGSQLGSRDVSNLGRFDIPVPAGDYTLEVESIRSSFTGGSSVGPVDPPIPMPGTAPSSLSTLTLTVAAGAVVNVPGGIVLQNTPPRFDAFEAADARPTDPLLLWLRRDQQLAAEREGA